MEEILTWSAALSKRIFQRTIGLSTCSKKKRPLRVNSKCWTMCKISGIWLCTCDQIFSKSKCGVECALESKCGKSALEKIL